MLEGLIRYRDLEEEKALGTAPGTAVGN